MLTYYHKIDAPFKRSEDGTKKLMVGVFRDETVEYLKDAQWCLTEKVDGTNISTIDGMLDKNFFDSRS